MPEPVVISLFSGAGGLDHGFRAAGFCVSACLDLDHDSCETQRLGRHGEVIEGDIELFSTRDVLIRAGVPVGELDVLVGGPPCQPFSKSGFWVSGDVRRMSDPRAGTVESYLRFVKESVPRALFFENVRGFAYAGKDEGLEYLKMGLDRINREIGTRYRPRWEIVQAADYGVPQLRERFLLVAEREGRLFEFPKGSGIRRTAWDALANVQPDRTEDLEVRGRWAELLPSIPEGQNYLWHTDRGGGLPLFGWRRRYWNFLLKLAKDRPSWTIQAQPGPAVGPFHWDNRRLSREELLALQTFPQGTKIWGGRQSVQRQIGNAVPSLLAEVFAREMRRQFFSFEYASTPKLEVRPRDTPPPPAQPSAVPTAFMSLVGIHAAHPGTGRGYAQAKSAAGLRRPLL